MKTPVLAALAALMVLGACAGVRQSAANPFNWFGGRESAQSPVPEGGFPELRDDRVAVAQVLSMAVEPVQGGALVYATGLPPTQGWWDAELRPDGALRAVDGELFLRFVLASPREAAPTGTPRSREVSAGLFVPNAVLAQTRRVTVAGAADARTVTRR